MLMRHFKFEVHPIGSPASVENLETYEDNLEFYQENNYSYIPMWDDRKYYDAEEGELKDISKDQRIDYDYTARWAVEALTELPFLFFPDYGHRNSDVSDHLIITAADLNKRVAKEMMYSVLADLENKFAGLIEDEYQDSESLFSDLSPMTIGRWQKAGIGGVQMHVAEYMTLSEMQKLIAKSNQLRSQLGFDSRNQFDKHMSGIVDLRNRVMHANRTIIESKSDVEQLDDRLSRVEALI